MICSLKTGRITIHLRHISLYLGFKFGVNEAALERFLERKVQEMELLLATFREENRICASECSRYVLATFKTENRICAHECSRYVDQPVGVSLLS